MHPVIIETRSDMETEPSQHDDVLREEDVFYEMDEHVLHEADLFDDIEANE